MRDSALPLSPDSDVFTFTVSLEVREDDGKGNFRSVITHFQRSFSSAYVSLCLFLLLLFMNCCIICFLLFIWVKQAKYKCNRVSLTFVFPLSSSTFCSPVPKDRDKYYFKLRQGVHKKVSVTVQQMYNQELVIERWVLGCGHQRSEIQMF